MHPAITASLLAWLLWTSGGPITGIEETTRLEAAGLPLLGGATLIVVAALVAYKLPKEWATVPADAALAIATAIAVGVLAWWAGFVDYHAALKNGAMIPFGDAIFSLLGGFVLCAYATTVAAARLARGRRDARNVGAAQVAVYVAALFAVTAVVIVSLRPSSPSAFEAGFAAWARKHVDAKAIRVWMAAENHKLYTAPPSPQDIESDIDASEWPAAIRRLRSAFNRPEFVLLFPRECEIWYGGGFGHWGITVEESAGPNALGLGASPRGALRFSPGCYVWCSGSQGVRIRDRIGIKPILGRHRVVQR